MHIKRSFLLLALALLLSPLKAQLKTYLNLEAGPHWSSVKVDDQGHYFEPVSAGSIIGGITLEQELISNLSVATGIYYQPYKTGLHMKDQRRMQSQAASHTALMIPLRLQYRIQPTEHPAFFSPRLTYLYCINSLPDAAFSNSGVLSAPDGPAFSYVHDQSLDEPAKHLLELGMSIGLRFSGLWQASFNFSYLSGVLSNTSSTASLAYTDQQGSSYTARYNSRSNGIYSTLSFNIPVSKIWQNRNYRIHSRIENSAYKGKSTERKGELYLGGEVGALWRLFYTSDPALGARPMEGRGLFRYANLHTGIYGGYMISPELGIDLGINYQRSNTYYALMFDHEVNFTGKTTAPMYLEIPLRFRYFYDLHKQKVFAVVYTGVSLLTQFSSGGYASPGDDFTYTDPATQAAANATASSSVERLSSFRPLLRMGTGVEYLLPMEFPIYVTGYINYMQGFMAAEEVSVTSTLSGGATTGVLAYHGSGWSFDVGIKIPMSFDDRQNCVRLTKKK
ncbi:MAG: hypothetical protein GY790_23310 [Bacteroidetes bacterium]|nr:hypothetical protein [Bacteroidota bacterium]